MSFPLELRTPSDASSLRRQEVSQNPNLNSGALFGADSGGMREWHAMNEKRSTSSSTEALPELLLSNDPLDGKREEAGETGVRLAESTTNLGNRPESEPDRRHCELRRDLVRDRSNPAYALSLVLSLSMYMSCNESQGQ